MKPSTSQIFVGLVLMITMGWIACDQGVGPQRPVERDGSITAVFKLADVDVLATSYKKTLRLYSVRSGNVNPDGTSALWQYEYVDSSGSAYCFHSTFRSVGLDSISRLRTGIMIFSHGWSNSDIALGIAEENGGSDFRSRKPGCTIVANLSQPLVPGSSPYWYVTYLSTTDRARFDVTVNAVTGSVSFPIIDRLQD